MPLNAGDIAIIAYNSDGNDDFAWVALTDIPAGEIIKFTDSSWQDTGFRTSEHLDVAGGGPLTWTHTSLVSAGTVIKFNGIPATWSIGTATGTGLSLTTAGDQIIAFQGSTASPTFIYGIQFANASNWLASGSNSTNTSNLPPGLSTTSPVTVAYNGNFDNGYYIGTTTGTKTAILNALSNTANWMRTDTGPLSQSNWVNSFTVTSSTQPDLTVSISDSPDPVTAGNGNILTYTLTASNNGTSNATGVNINFTLPTNAQVFNIPQAGGFQVQIPPPNSNIIRFTNGNINAGSNATLLVNVILYNAGINSATAVIDPNNTIIESNESNNSATASTTVNPSLPDLNVGTSTPGPLYVGTPFNYTLSIQNNGGSNASGIAVNFTLPANVTYNSSSFYAGSSFGSPTISGSTLTYTGGSINAGNFDQIYVNVTPTVAGTLGSGTVVADPNNNITESNEVNNSIGTATPTVNPSPGVVINQSGGSTNVTEGGATDSYTVVLNTQPTANVNIAINSGTQTTTNPTNLTFTTANWNAPQTVTVTAVDDAAVEGNHTQTISHTASSTDTNYNGITIASVTANVTDNDTAGVTITQSGGSTNITEGGATDTYDIVLTSQPTSDVTIAINNSSQTGTSPTSVTFTSANWNVAQTVTVTATNDNVAEGNHPATISHTATSSDGNYNAIAISDITANITDNDNAGVTITQSGGSTNITEGGATDTYDIVLTSQPTSDVTIAINNSSQTGTSPTSVTFTSANWNVAQTVTVTATNDNVAEGNHPATISHTATSSDANYNSIAISDIAANITDNDSDVTLAISPSSTTEDGNSNLVYTFTRTGVTSTPLTVNFNVGGTATFNTDYTVSGADTFNGSSGTVTFAANSTTANVTIDPTADSTVELDETVQLTLANGNNYNVVTTSPVTGRITNDDAAVEFSQANYQINENGTIIGANVTINRTGFINSAGSVQVQFANGTATGGTDFTNTTQTINFASGETSKTVTIPITEDTLTEGTENFTLSLVNPSANTTIGTQNTATVQIIDNDVPPTLAISDRAQSEGNNGTTNLEFTVSLNTASGLPVTVNYATQNNTATTADGDYNSAEGTLTFNPGETQKTVAIAVNGDTRYEPDETFEVKLTNPTNATISDDTGVGTIQNDDAIPTIAIANATSQNEGNSGTVTHTFNVTLSNVSSQTIGVNYNTADGTATTADSDYTATSGNLIFNPGETQKTITVVSNGDNKYETNETFNLNLSNPINATITNSVAVGTINNDDTIPTVAVADVTQNEGNSGTTNFIFPVTLSNPTYQTVTVNYATANGSSTAGVDYNTAEGTLTFNPGEIQKNITVAVIGNTTVETNKNFLVNLSNVSNATIGDNQAVGTILNDDAVPVNNAPFVNAIIPVQTTNANNFFNFSFAADTFKDIDVGDTLTYSATLANGNALPNWLFFNPTSRTFVGTPTSSDVGTIVLSVKATDSANASVTTPFALIVNGANLPQDPDCFCESFVRPDINNLPNVATLNPVNNTQSGSDSNDILIGTPVNDALYGNGGDDFLLGNAANDNLFGGGGNDIAFGDSGNDWIFGNKGNDFLSGNTGDDVINGGQGNDTLRGGQGNDFVRGGQDNDLILGDRGNDTLGGDKGNDTIFGDSDRAGSDLIFGGSGDDLLNGNAGKDTIFGEDGNDTLRGGQNDDIGFGDAGNDSIYGDLGNDSLCGGEGNDAIYGGSDRDELCGGAGNDLLSGNQGEDRLNGEEGDDTLYGGKDNDTLIGGADNDVLSGDLGNDLLTGGSGRDTFILTSGKGSDIINDFQNGQDLIGLGGSLSFAQLAIAQSNNNTLISAKDTGELLATLNGIQASLITQQAFIAV